MVSTIPVGVISTTIVKAVQDPPAPFATQSLLPIISTRSMDAGAVPPTPIAIASLHLDLFNLVKEIKWDGRKGCNKEKRRVGIPSLLS